ncbi:MAG: hypothetical protein BJ554DRAFT_7128 [Olpidium bornovanus]|uniref:Uncharacterized protein n=1 Tax=Olpidium bornovanus TaxID=278681 RepID=A0A8H8DMN5_9FUNG|nr:MAG: hypothetical protein BJ554DRAFT_7128 [Olpidium bornovanus]
MDDVGRFGSAIMITKTEMTTNSARARSACVSEPSRRLFSRKKPQMDSPPFVITIAQGLPPAGSHTVVPVAPLLPLPLAVRLLVSRGRGGDVADLNAFQVEFWTDLRGRGGDDWACEATLRPVACETVEGEEGAPGAASFAVTFAGELDLSAAGTRGRAEFAYRARPSQCAGWTWSGKGPQDNGVLTLLRCDEEPRPLEKTLALEASFAWERLFVPDRGFERPERAAQRRPRTPGMPRSRRRAVNAPGARQASALGARALKPGGRVKSPITGHPDELLQRVLAGPKDATAWGLRTRFPLVFGNVG